MIILLFMNNPLLVAIFVSFNVGAWSGDTLSVCSPSDKICAKIWMEKHLKYQIYNNGKSILGPSDIDMILSNNSSFSFNNSIRSHSLKKESHLIISPVPEKRKIIHDDYNVLSIGFKQPYKIEFRIYDDGVAYRFLTLFKDSVIIQNELAE